MDDGWIDLLAGDLSEEEESALIESTAVRLDSFLASHEEAGDVVSAIMETCLKSTPIDERSWDNLIESLDSYFGDDLAHMLSWLAYAEPDLRLQRLQQHASARVLDFVRTVLGLYGLLIRRAMTVRTELPDDWQNLQTNVFWNQMAQSFLLRIEFTKFNSERAVLEGSPDSMLGLTRVLIGMLSAVGDRSSFSEELVTDFVSDTDTFMALLKADTPALAVEE